MIIEAFRKHLDQYNRLHYKYVVADRAFKTPEWERTHQILNIRPASLGPMTPGPNRAETANPLFKKQVKVTLQSIRIGPCLCLLHAVSYRQFLREASLARKTFVPYGSVTPLESAPSAVVQIVLPN